MPLNPSPIKTCVLGVGLAGLTFHIPFILALPEIFTLHSVLERDPKTEGGKVKDRFGFCTKVYRSLEDVLKDKDIELIIIATPNATHYDYAKASLNAGKHVLVDKPITATAEQAKTLGQTAASKGLVLYAYQNMRWSSDFLALKKLLAEPENSNNYLGAITEFESHFDRYRKTIRGSWKGEALPAAGFIYDLGSHLIDQTLCLFGRPARIMAFRQNLRGIGDSTVDDWFTIIMHYDRGLTRNYPLTATLKAHVLSVHSPQVRYIVRGIKGTYTKYGSDVQEEQLKVMSSPTAILQHGYGMEPDYIWGTVEKIEADDVTVTKSIWPSEEPGAYIELFRNLAACIRGEETPIVKWGEATAVIEMIELAHLSAKEGVTVSVPGPS